MEKRMRYFQNPYPDYNPTLQAPVLDNNIIKTQLLETARVVFSKKGSDCDGGIYVGAAGITYAFLHIRNVLSKDESRYFLPLAQKFFDTHAKHIDMMPKKDPKSDADLAGFLLGKAGFYAVGAVLGNLIGNEDFTQQCIKNYINGAQICKPVAFLKQGSDELFVGRAGYLIGALWLQKYFGQNPQMLPPKKDLRVIWQATIQSGRKYASSHHSPCPLMYSYYGTEYLGAAHGLCSIIQTLLCFPEFIQEDPTAERDIKQTLDFYLSLQQPNGNFPCAMDEVGPGRRRQESEELIHWCHGAPGAIYMFAKAYLTFGDSKYLDACIYCGEVVWQRGLLRKGPGICHGVAGNGYVFLLLHKLLKEPEGQGKNLYRAARFADFLQTEEFKTKARTPDCPYSLYEGLAGTLCFLADLLHPSEAEFPFFAV